MNRSLDLIELIEKNPGIKFCEIMRKTGMKNGVLSHYARKLEGKGSVKVERRKGETRFYPLCVTDTESCLIKSLRQETPRRILLFLLDAGNISFAAIFQKVNKSQSRVSTCLSKLISDNIIETRIINLKKVYYIKNIDMVREIIQKYNPLLLERAAYNLADTFTNF